MISQRRKRLYALLGGLLCVSALVAALLWQMRSYIVFYYTPSEFLVNPVYGKEIRLGGQIATGSVKQQGQLVVFSLTDLQYSISVHYQGILPPMFREGQGTVARGRLDQQTQVFLAAELLTKHDENYRPPELKKLP